jgi:hypothetical protein
MLPENYTVKNEPKKYPLVPEGLYQIEIVDVEKQDNVSTPFGIKNQLKFKLQILDTDEKGNYLLYYTSESYNSGGGKYQSSKLYDFVCAIVGKQMDQNEAFSINDLIGKQAMVLVKHKPSKKTGEPRANVNTVMTAKKDLPSLRTSSSAGSEGLSGEELDKVSEDIGDQ